MSLSLSVCPSGSHAGAINRTQILSKLIAESLQTEGKDGLLRAGSALSAVKLSAGAQSHAVLQHTFNNLEHWRFDLNFLPHLTKACASEPIEVSFGQTRRSHATPIAALAYREAG